MPSFRSAFRWIAAPVATIVLSPVLGNWFAELAKEHGFYDAPSSRLERAMSWFTSIAALPGYQLVVGLVLGLTLGLWADRVLRIRERGFKPMLATEIDRKALANEAEQLGRDISALAAEDEGRMEIVRNAENEEFKRGRQPSGERTVELRAKLIEKYGEKYEAEVSRLISLAMKCISLDRSDIVIAHPSRIAALLGEVAAQV